MKVRKMTMIFVMIVIVAIVIYDVYALVTGGTEASISYLLMTWGYNYPVFSFAMGFVMGHLFWRIRNVSGTDKLGK